MSSFFTSKRGLAWLIIVLGFLLTRLGFFENVIYNIDEAEYAVAADALEHGWLPGVDLVGTTKPPGIAFLFSGLFDLFGRSMAVLHVTHLLIMIGTGWLVVELGIALWGLAAAIPAALLYFMATSSWNLPHEIIALNVESPGVLCLLPALLLAWKKPQAAGAVFLCGVGLGLAALFRQTLALFLLPIAAMVLFERAGRWKRLAWLVAGGMLPWLPVWLVYAAHGGVGWALDSWIRYPITYSRDTGVLGFLQAVYYNGTEFALYSAVPLAMAIGGAVILHRERRTRRGRFLGLMGIAAILAVCSGSRFFGHYWLQLFPTLALYGVPAWFSLQQRGPRSRLLLGGAMTVGVVLAALHFPLWRSWDRYAPPRGASFWRLGSTQSELKVGEFVRAHTTPDETIAVWGYCPQIYYHAQRLPGVRDYLCHYITGYSPGTFDPFSQRAVRPWGHPQAEQMFIDDLERRQPKYIFDLVPVDDYTFTFIRYSLRSYPMLANYVIQHYLPEGEIDKVRIYRRRTPADTWWPGEEDTK